MSIEQTLQERSGSKCELCTQTKNLAVYEIPPVERPSSDHSVLLCDTCLPQVTGTIDLDANHWRCINDSMWSQVPAVQILSWRLLKRLESESWTHDLLDMLYLDEESLKWAESGLADGDTQEITRDSNGAILEAGDTVTIIKDLDVKGANFTAKRGTTVKNISMTSNPEHIEGRVNGVRVVLVSKFMKKIG